MYSEPATLACMTKSVAAQRYDEIPMPLTGSVTRASDVDNWLELTRAQDPRVRARAAQHLCPCHTKSNLSHVWERVFELTGDPDVRVRGAAFHLIGDGSPKEFEPRIVEILESMYHDEDAKLRRRVRRLLAHYRRTGVLNVL
jgi:HEAT repeat protein